MRNDYNKRLVSQRQQPPARWQGGYWEHPTPYAPAAAKKPRKKQYIVFFIVIALLAAGVIAALCLSSALRPSLPAFGEWDGGSDYDYDPLATAETTIRRSESGGEARLVLTPQPAADTLTLGDIYDKNISSIVCITAMGHLAGSEGTGVILSSDGYILTNEHVIHGTRTVTVTLQDGKELDALLVGFDKSSDLAVLKVDADGLTPAEFGDSADLKVGDLAVAIGNPLGEEFRGTMTSGIISAINREVDTDNGRMTLIQTNAAINSGNSGGALINGHGQVVGITNMKMVSHDVTIEGLGFAIPTTEAKPIVDAIIAYGEVKGDPILGITVTNREDGEDGAVVFKINRHSDAYQQGLRVGDVITACNGKPVADIDGLLNAKEGLDIGETVTLTVLRNEKELTFTVKLMDSNEL
ncbi:MAG: PDZ domain-containing protein [Oscillospiraceae bacterium]|nr:PDZ domain-containing protein [Oscillospiraceae bacterium]